MASRPDFCGPCALWADLAWADVMRAARNPQHGKPCPTCGTPMAVRWVSTGYRLPMPERRPCHVCPSCFPHAAAVAPIVEGISS